MRSLSLCALFALTSLGCSKSEPAVSPAAPAPAAAAPVAKNAEAPRPTIEDNTFKLVLSGDPAYEAGKPGAAKLVLEARGGYHVNQDYPIRVDLKAPAGVKLTKASLSRPDAAQFGEHSAEFALPFEAGQGAHALTATVDFAVCTAETCVPDQRTVALDLNVR
ncbi:MAG: hypothetical protein ABW252_01780 [Polyangiales bacterium]